MWYVFVIKKIHLFASQTNSKCVSSSQQEWLYSTTRVFYDFFTDIQGQPNTLLVLGTRNLRSHYQMPYLLSFSSLRIILTLLNRFFSLIF